MELPPEELDWVDIRAGEIDAPGLIRMIRAYRQLSQRQLASSMGWPHSRIARMEQSEPHFYGQVPDWLAILHSAGVTVTFRLNEELFMVHPSWHRHSNRRRFPAHLPVRKVNDFMDHRLGWECTTGDPQVPDHTYDLYPVRRDLPESYDNRCDPAARYVERPREPQALQMPPSQQGWM
jgi:transcriptional regulator with XRE-family HTH domain